MSLDFNLVGEETEEECICSCCNNIHNRKSYSTLFWRNITHNLGRMAAAAGIYECLWRPDENGFNKAKDIIPVLEEGLKQLDQGPLKFRKFEPENQWGSYHGLLIFVKDVLGACKEFPEANIEVSR